ncbi:MAG: VWA-like domain-containing protein [Bacillota bacterium]|nr:VWA-like domain-containing protein [Bacillota bacterium]
MKKHIQTQSEWEQEMVQKIWQLVISELHIDLPFLSIALNSLEFKENETISTSATNGMFLYYNCEKILSLFKKNPQYLNRVYLHSVLHCLFGHLWLKQKKQEPLYGLACDIAVEYTIDHLQVPATKRILTLHRINTYKQIEQECEGISAPAIYYWLLKQKNIALLQQEFHTDDHRFWPEEKQEQASLSSSSLQQQWQKIARQSLLENQRRGKENQEGDGVLTAQIKASKNKRNYSDFLKKFSINREELHVNPDEFDLSYYSYGLRLYKNMPLIEEVETKEMKKIQEFVIVIDTSYSTSNQLVKNFLKETYTILSHTDSFFRKSHIRILQCDDKIQSDEKITNQEEMEKLLERFTILGGGNTDFRPPFTYVNQLIEQGEFKNLSGLLYFTDGKGIYPKTCPSYKSAFLYLEEYDATKVPPWAITYSLDPMEFRKE